jgi:hypothetical protein
MEIGITYTTFRKIATEVGTPLLLRFGRQIARIAKGSMVRARGPAQPGDPPHKHYGDLERSIAVAVDETTGDVQVGPRASIVGQRGSVLEFAGTYDPDAGRDQYGRFLTGHASRKAPSGARWAHPFMRPAFEQAVDVGAFEGGSQIDSSFT